jgi:hypothetical protein
MIVSFSALGEVGLSAFALQHPKYPCAKFLEAYKGVASPSVAILDGWFGSDVKCLNRFLSLHSSGTKLVQIHIRYVPKNQIEYLDVKTLSRRARKWEGYAKKYPNVKWLLSDGLESHDSARSAKRRISFIKRYFHGPIVHNPLNERDPDIVGADYIELHEPRYRKSWGRKTIFNYDGFGVDYRNEGRGLVPFQTSIPKVRSDIAQARRDGSIVFLWDCYGQGTCRTGVSSDPTKRSFEIIGNTIKNSLLGAR